MIVPGYEYTSAIAGPIEAVQAAPSSYDQVAALTCRCGAQVDLILVGAFNNHGPLRAIGRQSPIAPFIDLWRVCTLAVANVEAVGFHGVFIDNAVEADG